MHCALCIALAAFAVSCDKNENPVFNDDDAFVAFDKASASYAENVGEIKIPVTLASIQGIATTVSYEAVNGTAVAGKDFELVDGSGTLTFSAEGRTQYIAVKIIDRAGEYTGDLKFSLKFKSAGSVAIGAENSCTITILDLDHPLASILNTYKASGKSYFNGDSEWERTLLKDESDPGLVWFENLVPDTKGFYGIVTMEDGAPVSIALPLGQVSTKLTTSNGDGNVYLFGLTNDLNLYDEGNIIITIKDGGARLEFDQDYGPSVNLGGTNYYVDLIYPGAVAVKK